MNYELHNQGPATASPKLHTEAGTRQDVRVWEVRTPWSTLTYISKAPKLKSDTFDLSAKKMCIPPSAKEIEAAIWAHIGLANFNNHTEATEEQQLAAIDAAIAEASPTLSSECAPPPDARIYHLPEPLPPLPEKGNGGGVMLKLEMFGRQGVWVDGGERGMLAYWPSVEEVMEERKRVLGMRLGPWYAVPISGEEKRMVHGCVIRRKEIALMAEDGDV